MFFSRRAAGPHNAWLFKILPAVRINCKRWMFFSRRAARPHNALTFKDLTNSSEKLQMVNVLFRTAARPHIASTFIDLTNSSDSLQKVNVLFPKGRSTAQCFDFFQILPTVRINCKRWMFFSRKAARPHNALTFKDLNNSSDSTMLWLFKSLPTCSIKLQKVNVLFPKGRSPAQCFDF